MFFVRGGCRTLPSFGFSSNLLLLFFFTCVDSVGAVRLGDDHHPARLHVLRVDGPVRHLRPAHAQRGPGHVARRRPR